MSNPIYNPTWQVVLYRSLRMVGAYPADQKPRPEQVSQALEVLCLMLKEWQIDLGLWLITPFQLPLVAGTSYYQLGPAGTAQYWPLLTETIGRPTRVWNLRRKTTQGIEVPLNDGLPMSRVDYMALPNKTTTGTVVNAYYDPQLVNGIFYVWPTPYAGTTDVIIGDCDRPIQVPTTDLDTFDLPQEWLDPISFCLAERLWFEYPASGAEYQLLAQRALMAKEAISNYNREIAETQYNLDYRR